MSVNETIICYHCGKDTGLEPANVGRGDDCPHCRMSVRVCRNCVFYDPKAYNECREPAAERVVDKEKPNFCDFFRGRTVALTKETAAQEKQDMKTRAEALFKKK